MTSDAMVPLKTREFSVLPGKTFVHRDIRPLIKQFRPDAIIVEQAIKNIENWQLLLSERLSGTRLGFWGHGRSFSSDQTSVESSVKQWMTRRGSWFFSYTQEGSDFVVENGFPAEHVTVVNNSFDTRQLRTQISSLSGEVLSKFRDVHTLTVGKTALYLGGMDGLKAIPWLLECAGQLIAEDPEFRLLLVGAGELSSYVSSIAAENPAIKYLGARFGLDKAIALASADFLMIPRGIGLVALDSLVAGKPIVTTRSSQHGPEFHYLEDGKTAVVVDYNQSNYVKSVRELLANHIHLNDLQSQCRVESMNYSVEQMVDNFATGVTHWLGTEPHGSKCDLEI